MDRQQVFIRGFGKRVRINTSSNIVIVIVCVYHTVCSYEYDSYLVL